MRFCFLFCIFFSFANLHAGTLVAVNKISPEGIGEVKAVMLTDAIRSEVTKTGKFDVVERSEVDKITQEQALVFKGAIDDSSDAPKSGKMLPAEYQFIGRVYKENKKFTLNLRLVNSETGKIENDETMHYKGSFEGLIEKVVPEIVQKVSGTYVKPKKNRAPWIAAGVVTLAVVPAVWYFTTREDDEPEKESLQLEVEW